MKVDLTEAKTARLDLTREELFFTALSFICSIEECEKDQSVIVTKIFTKLLKKVQEAAKETKKHDRK